MTRKCFNHFSHSYTSKGQRLLLDNRCVNIFIMTPTPATTTSSPPPLNNKSTSVVVKMEDIPEEPERKIDLHSIRIKAWKLCRNYLTGVWKVIKAEDLILKEIV